MSDNDCPWDTNPLTLDATIDALEAKIRWEDDHGPCPSDWNVMASAGCILDIGYRIQALEYRMADA